MSDAAFTHDVFLSHSAKDKAVVRPLAERLRADGVKMWFDEWVLKPGDSIPAKIEEGLERSRVLVLCMSANAFGSDWAQLESQTFRFRDPLNRERRFIPLRLDDAPIKGSLAQFLYINWRLADREQEYAKLLAACRGEIELSATNKPSENLGQEPDPSNPSKLVHFEHSGSDDSVKLEVTASLALENTDTRHGLLTIKALNLGSKVVRIRRVAVVLKRDEPMKGSALVNVSSELNIGQKQTLVKIEGDEDMHEWQQILRFKPNFEVHEKEGERYGKGYVELTSGKRVEFEFLLLPDSAWDWLTAPIAPIFDGKMGRKCPHCGFMFLTQANATAVTCPKCKSVAPRSSSHA